MDENTWTNLTIEINEYLEVGDLDAGLTQVVRLHMQVGENNPAERGAAGAALRALLKGRVGTPFRRGQKSSVPASVRVSIDKICQVVEEASIAYFNFDSIIKTVTIQHAKSGGGQFESAEHYAKIAVKRTRNTLSRLFKEGSWDGSMQTLLSEEE